MINNLVSKFLLLFSNKRSEKKINLERFSLKRKEIEKEFRIDDSSFEEYFRYLKYEDGFFWTEDSAFFILEILGGIYYYAMPEDLLSYYAKLITFLRAIPEEAQASIQSLFVSYRSVDFDYKEAKTDSELIRRIHSSVVEKVRRAEFEGYFDQFSKLRDVKNFLVISFPLKTKKILDRIESKLDRRDKRLGSSTIEIFSIWKRSLIAALDSLSVKYRELDPSDFLYLMFQIWNQDFSPIRAKYVKNVPLKNQLLYNLVTTDHHEIAFSRSRFAVAYVDNLEAVSPGFLTELITLKRPFVISMNLKRVSREMMKLKLIAKKRSTLNRTIIRKLNQVIDEIDLVNPYEAEISFAFLVDDYKEISLVKSELSNFISEYGFKIEFEDLIAPDMFLSMMPAHQNSKIKRTVNLYEDFALCFLNFRNFRQKFSDSGILLVGEDLKPRYVNVFDSLAYGTMISGGSGSGKTFFSQYAMLMALANDERVFAIDPLGNLEPLANLLGASYYRIGLSEDTDGLTIFPQIDFQLFKKNKDLVSQVLETIIKLITLGSEKKTLSASERAFLQKTLLHMYENAPKPSIKTFHDVLEAFYREEKEPIAKEFAAAVSLFLPDGAYGGLISERPLDLSNKFIIFDLSPINERKDLTEVCLFSIMTLISEIILNESGRKHVFVDEAHYLIHSKENVNFLSSGIRIWRTFGGAMYIITQQLTDLLENQEVGSGIFKTINNFFLFSQSASSFIHARNHVGYNLAELSALKSLRTEVGKYSFFAYYTRSMRDGLPAFGRFYLSLPRFLYWVLTTDTEEKEKRRLRINHFLKKGYSKTQATIKALESLIEEENKSAEKIQTEEARFLSRFINK